MLDPKINQEENEEDISNDNGINSFEDWCDLYVDASGNCFSDADPGL